nr:unnamed protein product [Digitaria exilis]
MGGVKVTYIETSFVTSDVAGFKHLVQRLTGRSPTVPAPATVAPHRPRPRSCHANAGDSGRSATAAAAGPQGWYHVSPPAAAHEARVGDGRIAPPCPEVDETFRVADFPDVLLYGGASQSAQCGHGGYYSDFFTC